MLRRNMHLGASRTIFKNAYALREKLTEAEEILWERLRNRQVEGVRFRRQHPMHRYVADFYAHQYKLIIEVDGKHHNDPDQKSSDGARSEELIEQGITILRFSNTEVIHSIDLVVDTIRTKIIELRASKVQARS